MATATTNVLFTWGRVNSPAVHLVVSAGWSTVNNSEGLWMGTYNWTDDATVRYMFNVLGCANSFLSGGVPTFPTYQCRLYDVTNSLVVIGPVTISSPRWESAGVTQVGPLTNRPGGDARLRLEYTGGGTDGSLNGAEFFAATLEVTRS